ncbi:uncharacterized protein LOC123675628 [Harmonia axyridis]|uniref:uncharacterized protein LOC123675628 n=1 Tax=Harmonia axyridis TaxID=115357 RepID=UPI001E277BC8|nr:uncharacterized protein LOC123675628 [Harmonia axyridis]
MSTIIAEKLIEEVRKRPVLYDQSNELYRNVEHKDQVWKRVAKELNIEGQDEECKKKWNGIRDSFRRARQKKKTKCGQLTTSATKYIYEALLEFLIPHLAERKTLCNAPDEDGDSPETVDESQQPNFQPLDSGCADEPETQEPSPSPPPTIPVSQVAIVKKFSHAARKRKLSDTEVKSQESASSQLMAYILAEKEAEKTSQPSEKHPVDAFLAGIAPSLKSLDPFLLIAAKGKIFNIVQEYELEQLRVHRERATTLAYMSLVSSGEASSVATPLNVEVSGSCTEGHFNFSTQVPTAVNQPAINPEE